MNLYEFEGKNIFSKFGIATPRGILLHRDDNVSEKYQELEVEEVVLKAQVLSGKRGKNNGIRFCSSIEEVESAVQDLFNTEIRGQY
ncbi:MAG: succinate--CoA ligase subunit beta, partial [bacterium]|nr:succinate--CoA ligase subunit beta [bacterium]